MGCSVEGKEDVRQCDERVDGVFGSHLVVYKVEMYCVSLFSFLILYPSL